MPIRQILDLAYVVLDSMARLTATELDDHLLVLIDAVRNSPQLMAWLEALLDSTPAGALPQLAATCPDHLELELGAIPWSKLLQLLPVLLEIIRAARPQGE